MSTKHSYAQLKKDILFEQEQIEKTVAKIKKFKRVKDEAHIAAIAAYLMNFYNGVENIMKRCAQEYYREMPVGSDWHKKLLQQSCAQVKNKNALFNQGVVDALYDYLTFRHFFIHGYGFALDWDKMAPLIGGIDKVWLNIKESINKFIKGID